MITSNLTKRSTTKLVRFFAISLVLSVACFTRASTNNLLINGDFNAGPSGWETWGWHSESWGSHWANFEIPNVLNPSKPDYNPALVGVYDGTLQLTVGANGGGGAGAFQIIAATPGVEYTLTVQNGVQNWWKPVGEIRMIWLNATNGEISRDVVLTTCAINANCEPGNTDVFDVGIPYANWTNVATAPVDAKFLKVELTDPVGTGSIFFDDANLTAPIDPPVIGDIYPNGLLQATNSMSFTAKSAAPINGSGVVVTVNGVDVSGSLVFAGSGTTNLSVSYPGLQSNRVYSAVINVTDTANLSSFKNVSFDTYAPIFTWEAEDYDYGSGQYINHPTPSDTPAAGSYFGLAGTEGVDFHDQNNNGSHGYRGGDWMGTETAGDPARQQFVAAGASDYNVGWFDGANFAGDNVGITSYDAGEWVNYTRDFPAGSYNIYGRLANGNGGTATIPLSMVVNGWGTSDQTTTNLGSFKFAANGWASYGYAPLTDKSGNRIAVSLSGTKTLRVTAGSGGNLNFFMLVPVDTEQPTITSLYPDGSTLLQGTNALTFTASSANHAIAQSNVVVILNGDDVSESLSFSGTSGSWNVSAPLMLNTTNYVAIITVTDDVGNSHSTTVYFDTFNPGSYHIQAVDWDFGGGQFIDNPVVTSAPAANSYFETLGTAADAYQENPQPPTTAPFRYRSLDTFSTDVCSDTPGPKLMAAQLTNALAFNYNIAYWTSNSWANYTHTYPAGQYLVYARLAGGAGAGYTLQLDQLSPTTSYLGTFIGVGRGFNLFDWIPLVNTNSGQMVTVTLGGVATLRATTFGEVNPNSYLLVPAMVSPETLSWSNSTSGLTLSWNNPAFHLQAQTNAPGSGISTTWGDYPGGGVSPVTVPAGSSLESMFFRLSN